MTPILLFQFSNILLSSFFIRCLIRNKAQIIELFRDMFDDYN